MSFEPMGRPIYSMIVSLEGYTEDERDFAQRFSMDFGGAPSYIQFLVREVTCRP